jgi:hypothetical protein
LSPFARISLFCCHHGRPGAPKEEGEHAPAPIATLSMAERLQAKMTLSYRDGEIEE